MPGLSTMKNHLPICELKSDEPMARHTSWRAGGKADRYAVPKNIEELKQLMSGLTESEAVMWMGLGSNTLIRDGGFRGTIVATQYVMNELSLLDNGHVFVGAGVADAKLARFCAKKKLSGAQFFAGIPGLLGGALAMNAGAWGGETWQHVVSVETMNHKGEIKTRSKNEFDISYRHVGNLNDEWFVSAMMHFNKQEDEKFSNKDVIDIKQLLAKRAQSQPTGVASCGSVFRNPEGDHAARLIESCGLKGMRIGGAVISEKHANFIINDKQASAEDIESLIELMQQKVKAKYDVSLQTEVRITGERLSETNMDNQS